MAKGSFPEEGFLGGLYLKKNGAWKALRASVLKECEFLTMHHLKKNCNGRITVVYIYYRYPPWEVNGSIYIPMIPSKRYFLCIAKGRFCRKKLQFTCMESSWGRARHRSISKRWKFISAHVRNDNEAISQCKRLYDPDQPKYSKVRWNCTSNELAHTVSQDCFMEL